MTKYRNSGEGLREETGQRKRQKVSNVWDCSKLKQKEKSMQCFCCKTKLAYYSSMTSVLKHLNRKHPVHGADTKEDNINVSINVSLLLGYLSLELPTHLPSDVRLMMRNL